MGPRFRVSSERLEKPGIEPSTPGLEGEQLNHYATEASLPLGLVFDIYEELATNCVGPVGMPVVH